MCSSRTGKEGCLYLSGGEIKYQPAFQVQTVDTFAGYFVTGVCKGNSFEDCVRFASAAATLAAAKKETTPSILERADIGRNIDTLVSYGEGV